MLGGKPHSCLCMRGPETLVQVSLLRASGLLTRIGVAPLGCLGDGRESVAGHLVVVLGELYADE